jgi:hypothetical protein
MFKSNLVAGVIGVAILSAFLGTLLVWLKSVPLTIITLCVVGLVIYDLIKTLREGNSASGG